MHLMIHGIEIKELVTRTDERGFLREIIRATDSFFGEGFGQWNHALMYPGAARAWHIHARQAVWWYVIGGPLKVVLCDLRLDSPTQNQLMELFMGDHYPARVLKIPPGVAYGSKVIGATAHLLTITSRTYDPSDEGRLPHDDPAIGYDWTAGAAIT
jgi:dTDP-4-dehydrorhamnose 3,5-epimerase